MRPTKLTMSAFGPYAGEITLELEKITDGGIYLICGETGAGKTMIFDAIAYALYGEASGSAREASMLRSRFASPETATFVCLEFESDEKKYTVYREWGREKLKKGVLKEEISREAWIKLPDGKVISKHKDVTAAVCEIIGMDRDRFRRTVMIAQGEFRELLYAKTEERMVVLRKIFKTDIYALFSEKAKSECTSQRHCTDVLRQNAKRFAEQIVAENELGDYLEKVPDVSGAELKTFFEIEFARAEEKITLLESEREKSAAELNVAAYMVNRARDDCDNTVRLNAAKAELAKADAELASAESAAAECSENMSIAAKLRDTLTEYKSYIPFYEEKDTVRACILQTESDIEKFVGESLALKEKTDAKEVEIREISEKINSCDELCGKKEMLEIQLEKSNERLCALDGIVKMLDEYECLTSALCSKQEEYKLSANNLLVLKNKFSESTVSYFDGIAGILSSALRDGEPCPVCGSAQHPCPAKCEENRITREQLDDMRDMCDKAAVESERLAVSVGELRAQCDKLLQLLEAETGSKDCVIIREKSKSETAFVLNKANLIKEKLAECTRAESELLSLRDKAVEYGKELTENKINLDDISEKLIRLNVKAEEQRARLCELDKKYTLANLCKLENEIEIVSEKISLLETAAKNAEKRLCTAELEREACASAVRTISLLLKDSIADRLSEHETLYAACESHLASVEQKLIEQKLTLEKNRASFELLMETYAELEESERRLTALESISDTSNGNVRGKDKIKLETFWQMRLFDRIIRRANLRLMKMTDGRYELLRRKIAENQKEKSGLELDIIDRWNGRERNVRTLSGGEAFSASLALALALSDETEAESGGVKIDAMFIDEGFGSLDEEALESAVSVLESQSETGRSVGIISHVQSLRDKIERQIIVSRSSVESDIKVIC